MIWYWAKSEEIAKRWVQGLSPAYEMALVEQLSIDTLKENLCGSDLFLLQLENDVLQSPRQICDLRAAIPELKIITFADLPTDSQAKDLLRAGVFGYCNTYMDPALLTIVIQAVCQGQVWVGWDLMQTLIVESGVSAASPVEPGRDFSQLTQRELEVCERLVTGGSNKAIAQAMDISERTVKNHLRSIFKKTGCRDRLNLAMSFKQSKSIIA